MIREYELYHGSVLLRLCKGSSDPISIMNVPFCSAGGYRLELNGKSLGLYVKYCTKRLSPWRFTFHQEHQNEIDRLFQEVGGAHVALVCGDDGIVVLDYKEFRTILDENHEPTEWLCVSRRKREMYVLKGKDGRLDFRVGETDFPKKTLSALS